MKLKTVNFRKDIDVRQWNKIRNQKNNYPNLKAVKQLILEEEKKYRETFST